MGENPYADFDKFSHHPHGKRLLLQSLPKKYVGVVFGGNYSAPVNGNADPGWSGAPVTVGPGPEAPDCFSVDDFQLTGQEQ
jgi:hypothetical protein